MIFSVRTSPLTRTPTGVPMGGDLTNAPEGKAPAFLVQALRDPDGANLDRLQIIKGWLDADGNPQERIYDIAVSDGRTIGADGRCKDPVGNTVNVEEATYSNAIGDAVLGGYWQDPDFDPAQRAFYYVRVLEIPTPRWTTYDAKFFGVKRPEDVPASYSGARLHLADLVLAARLRCPKRWSPILVATKPDRCTLPVTDTIAHKSGHPGRSGAFGAHVAELSGLPQHAIK